MIYVEKAHHNSATSRNELLQNSLRENSNRYSIDLEYPLVLGSNVYGRSFCLFDEALGSHLVLAHLNFFPRKVMNHNKLICNVGLIGNIATKKEYRGLGFIKCLMQACEQKAIEADLSMLILWSHLEEFYQKFGFSAFGKEFRFYLKPHLIPAVDQVVFRLEEEDIDARMSEHLKNLRLPSFSLERSHQEFAILLSIPDTVLLSYCENGLPRGYVIIGKGQDMVGVIHEWGADSPEILSRLAGFIQKQTGYQQIILLAPSKLDLTWKNALSQISSKVEQHPLCLAKILKNDCENDLSENLFIWGLDSI